MGRFARSAVTAVLVAATSSCALVGAAGLGRSGARPGVDVPSRAAEAAAAPLGAPGLAPIGVGGYAFSMTQADGTTPVAFDPCRPVHYVVRAEGEPSGGAALLRWAFDRLTEATGLQFVDDGPTDEGPSEHRPSYQPDRYGDRWAPVLVVWSSGAETAMVAGAVLGRAGPDAFGTDEPGSLRYVSGEAVFNGPALDVQLRTGDDAKARAVLLHELGHLVGLAHVADPYQVMYDTNAYPLGSYRDGDRRGLEQLGMGRCFRDV
ncbi:MAG TPA: matrixin family metalloprotease [Actinomycetes bacterium]